MSKAKNYNRIVFLTTLSVYLGLALVGGTAPVLAHSALNKHFDIRNEIKAKDDFDNKPDGGEESKVILNDAFPALLVQLLNEIRAEIKSGKIAAPLQTEFFVSGVFSRTEQGSGGAGFGYNDLLNPRLKEIIDAAITERFQPKAVESGEYEGKWKIVKISVGADKTNFSLKISFAKSDAEQFAAFLNREYASFAVSAQDDLTKQVYEHTKASSENNQVFIVTRLPRAGIDSLLK